MTQRTSLFILLLLFALILSACTGTAGPSVPTLLVVGYGEADAGSVALVLDSGEASEERLTFLEDSVRDLPATPVAYDLVDRGGLRSELVVLSRSDTGEAIESYLSFFNLEGIDPDAPIAFERSPGSPDIFLNDFGTDDIFSCPTDIAVSSTGRYVVIVEDQSVCGVGVATGIHVLDTVTEEVSSVEATPILPGGIFLDQADNVDQENILYFATEEASGVRINAQSIEDIVNDVGGTIRQIEDVPLGIAELRDLGPVQNSLVVLFDNRFAAISDYQTSPTLEDRDPEEDLNDARQLILDDTPSDPETPSTTPNVLVLGGSRFWVFESVEDEEADDTTLSAVDGVLDPLRDFVFFVRDGGIRVFDLLTHTPGEDPEIRSFSITEIADPTFITWARPAPEEVLE